MEPNDGTRRRRRRRWPLVVIAGALAFPAALLVGTVLALRAHAVRSAVLATITRRVDREFHLAVAASDFSVAPRRGVVELDDVVLGVPNAPPLLRARHVRIEVEPGSLLRDVIVIRSVEIEAPRLDLAAPIPALPQARPGATTPHQRRLEVLHAALHAGSVAGGPIPARVAAWVSGWSVDGIELAGSFRGNTLDLTAVADSIAIRLPDRRAVTAKLEARIEGDPARELRLTSLSLIAPGLALTASGSAAIAPPGPIPVTFGLEVDATALAPGLGLGGHVTASGKVDLRSRNGAVSLHAQELALAAARRWLPAEWFDRLALDGTTLDLVAEAHGALGRPEAASGKAELHWRRGERELAQASATLSPSPQGDEPGIKLACAASLLPGSPGQRTVSGTLRAASLLGLGEATVEASALSVTLPDVAVALREARAIWPRLIPAVPPGVPVAGSVEIDARVRGSLFAPLADLHAAWRPSAESRVELVANGAPLARHGEATLTVDRLPVGLFVPQLSGVISATAHASGSPSAFEANLTLDGRNLAGSPDGPNLDALHLEAATDGKELRVATLTAAMGNRRVAAHGRASLTLPLAGASFAVHLDNPVADVPAADLDLDLHAGILTAGAVAPATPVGPIVASVELPLGALREVPLGQRLASLPLVIAEGPVRVLIEAPDVDICTTPAQFGLAERAERLHAALAAQAWLDPVHPAAGTGEVILSGLELETGGYRVTAERPITLTLANGELHLDRASITSAGARLDLEARARLAEAWAPRDAPLALVRDLSLAVHGVLPAPLLDPFLRGGGEAIGTLRLDLTAQGSAAHPAGELSLDASDATFLWPVPYATKLTQARVGVSLGEMGALAHDGHCLLNGGPVDFTARLGADRSLDAQATFSGVRYTFDFGLRTVLSGELDVAKPPGERALVSGRVSLDRGALVRDIDLDRELLPFMMAPPRTPGTETNLLDMIDLDVTLETARGVRVKDNLADLHASWEPLEIQGTAWIPSIVGRIEVDPGGLVYAYGQTFRLDRAAAIFTGDPATDPRLDFAVTSSLQDPTIGRARDLLTTLTQPPIAQAQTEAAGAAISTALAAALGQHLGESLGLGSVSVRPLPVWGEADPSARLTISRDLSSYVAFLVSLDLRGAQGQTYLLDLHGLHLLPSLEAQAFTNDAGHHGATLQQSFDLGGVKPRTQGLPRLHEVVVEGPQEISRRTVRDALAVGKDDVVRDGAALDAEVDVTRTLREDGYPDAQVSASVRPTAGKPGQVDLVIAVEPGPRVAVHFVGDALPAASRREVAALYRTDAHEGESRDDMRVAAERVLRALGYLAPQVEVGVARERPDDAASPRTVTVVCHAGKRVAIATVNFTGIPEAEAALVAKRFELPLARTELAAALSDADARVTQSLRTLGYHDGRVVARTLSVDGARLDVKVTVGARDRLATVTVTGVSPEEEKRLLRLVPARPGDPARADRIAAGAAAIGDDQRARGFAEARVKTVLTQAVAEAPTEMRLTYEVTAGQRFHLAGVHFAGLRWTSTPFAQRLAGLLPDQPLRASEIAEARTRVFGAGMFASVVARTDRQPDGSAVVTFTAVERPPFTLAYGLRWESEVGASAVVDLVDHNLLGRGVTAGARLAYEADNRSARFYVASPDLFGTRNTLEAFAERSRVIQRGLITDATLATLQLSRPLGRNLTAHLYARFADTHIFEQVPDPFFPFDERIRHPYLGAQLILDTRDDPVLAHRGVLASADLSGSGHAVGSDFDYLRWFGQLNLYHQVATLAGAPMTWDQSVRVGLARAFAGQDLIPDVRFFAGGEYSVRGYPNNSLGPTESLGSTVTPAGGAALLVVNEELRVPLVTGLFGLVFFDAGQVWASTSEFGRGLAKSLGLGLRAATPIGVLRLDAAHPLNRPPGDKAVRFTLGFGNVF